MSSFDSNTTIHPTAIVADGAAVGSGTVVGPYCVIGEDVRIGKNNHLKSHVVLEGHTTLGDGNTVFPFASIGTAPQDLKYAQEPSTLEIGSSNIIREYVTLQPGTAGGGMRTAIGDQNLFMASSHVGHDCMVGSSNVFANSCALSGHVHVGSHVIIGGLVGVHQFVRLGDHCFIGAGSMVAQDIPPYLFAEGNRAQLAGVNKIGLKRRGFSAEDIRAIFRAFQEALYGDGAFRERVQLLHARYQEEKHLSSFFQFILESERGIAAGRRSGVSESTESE